MRLDIGNRESETVNFDWQKLPPGWSLATSFGASSSPTGRCQTYVGPWVDVAHGLYAAGDFRIHSFWIDQRLIVLAVRGAWTFTDDEAIADLKKVIGAVRHFWGDNKFPYFLVTLKPYDRDRGSSDGSAFTNAFWMYVWRLDSISDLLPQLAHESFHAWNRARMGIMPPGGGEAEVKWFSEGATEYYAQLLTYRAGQTSIVDYVIHSIRIFWRFHRQQMNTCADVLYHYGLMV